MNRSELTSDIERLAPRLGELEARSIDPDRMASAVLDRLRDDRPMPEVHTDGRRYLAVLRYAAVFAVLAIGGLFVTQMTTRTGETATPDLTATVDLTRPDLNELASDELIGVLAEMAMWAPSSEPVTAELVDLEETELELLLMAMDEPYGTDQGV
jgi:hypothetical protein